MNHEPSTGSGDARMERVREVVGELQARGEERSRRLREVARRTLRTRRELVRLLGKEFRRQADALRSRSASEPASESAGSPSSSKS